MTARTTTALLLGSLAFLLSSTYATARPAKKTTFAWGVCGHPDPDSGYSDISIEKQLDLVAGLGATWYRVDWDQHAYDSNPGFFERLVRAARKRHIQILPILYPINRYASPATDDQVRQGSFEFAKRVAAHFGKALPIYELDNELDGYSIYGGSPGDSLSNYDEAKYQREVVQLRGLQAGVKAGDRSAQVMIDTAGWLHYGFIQRLVNDHVPFDILGWHWYSDMGDITQVEGRNVWTILRGFGKPIWLTEINVKHPSTDPNEASYIAQTAAQFRRLPGCHAYFPYELLDEPYKQGDERSFGLVAISTENGKRQVSGTKDAYTAYQRAIASFSRTEGTAKE
jgi:hypothetical protein